MEFKCKIERQVIIEDQPKIWVGWGRVGCIRFSGHSNARNKASSSILETESTGDVICHG